MRSKIALFTWLKLKLPTQEHSYPSDRHFFIATDRPIVSNGANALWPQTATGALRSIMYIN